MTTELCLGPSRVYKASEAAQPLGAARRFRDSGAALLIAVALLTVPVAAQSPASGEQATAKETLPRVADTLLDNGRIYTGDPQQPWAQAMALRDGRLVYVGEHKGAREFAGPQTRIVDLDGKLVMPGINDAHSHPAQGGVKLLYQCDFPFTAGPDDIAEALRACIARNPGSEWIIGGQWTSDFFRNHSIPSPREFLDAISTDHAIVLSDDSGHNAWVNSRALSAGGIGRETPNPRGGTIVRDATGEPTGLLYESGRAAVFAARPDYTVAEYEAAISEALSRASSFGLTGVNEARAAASVYQAYRRLDAAKGLPLRVVANQQTPRGYRDYPLVISDYIATRERFDGGRLQAGFVKIFLDGVPTASRTALMLADYQTDADHPKPTRGELMVDPAVLTRDLVALDAAGFTVKIHTAGDGSVRVALDAITEVRRTNGSSGLRHELAHAGYIAPEDLPRFAALNVTADLSPYIWFPSPIIDSVMGAIGKRGAHYFPVTDLLDSGANVLMGSDWPSAARNLSPWHAIEALVTRRNPFGSNDATLWPEQAVSLQQAVTIATLGGARAMRLEGVTGSLVAGKSADFIVLDRNIFDIPIDEVSDTQVLQTWFEGGQVYSRGQ